MTKKRKKKKESISIITVFPTHYDLKDNFKSFNETYNKKRNRICIECKKIVKYGCPYRLKTLNYFNYKKEKLSEEYFTHQECIK